MRKLLLILLFLMTATGMAGCADNKENQKNIVGIWQLSEEEPVSEYGVGIEFAEDGSLYYGLTANMIENLAAGQPLEVVHSGVKSISTMEYKIKNENELDVVVHILHGIKKQKETINYSLTGDTLIYDGLTYQRLKENKEA